MQQQAYLPSSALNVDTEEAMVGSRADDKEPLLLDP